MGDNKYAVISAVGDQSLHETWIAGKRNFDVILIYFGDNQETHTKLTKQVEQVIKAKGQKLHIIGQLISQNVLDLSKYDYVWLPDDDIAIDTPSINNFFAANTKFKTLISQPAVLGYTSHSITKHQPQFFARATNFIEVMAPCFEKSALKRCLNTFVEEESGWGVDYIWWHLVGQPQKKVMIFDAYPMIHTRPIQSNTRFPGAWANAQTLLKKYGVGMHRMEIAYLMYHGWWAPKWLAKLITRVIGNS